MALPKLIIVLIWILGLKLLRIQFDSHQYDLYMKGTARCPISEASALYGFSKELMPDLEIIVEG